MIILIWRTVTWCRQLSVRFYEARENGEPTVTLWGDGLALREFTYSGDIANALLYILHNYNEPEPINIGDTREISIRNIAELIVSTMDYRGKLVWDTSMPKGQLRKPSSNKKFLELGWDAALYTPLETALIRTCTWFEKSYPNVRGVK